MVAYSDSYVFQGYMDDDCEELHNLLDTYLKQTKIKDQAVLYYDEDTDVTTFNFNTGEILVKLRAETQQYKIVGIAMDCENSTRVIGITVACVQRKQLDQTMDAIAQVINTYNVRPWGNVNFMRRGEMIREPFTQKYYQATLNVYLERIWQQMPRANTFGLAFPYKEQQFIERP